MADQNTASQNTGGALASGEALADPRSHFMERLARDRGEPQGQPTPHDDQEDILDEDLDDQEHGQPEDSQGALLEEEPDDEDGQPDLEDDPEGEEGAIEVDGEQFTPSAVRELIQDRDKAVEARDSMEKDYRRKTMRIAEIRGELETDLTKAQNTAQFFANLSQQSLQQFASVDWEALKAKPEEYVQKQQQWMAANAQAQQFQKAVTAIQEEAQSAMEKARQKEAQMSLEILRGSIDGWSNELYSELRQHAVDNLDYSPEAFNDITDWRIIRLIERDLRAAKAKTSIRGKVKTDKVANPPTTVRRREVARDDNGKFVGKARQALNDNPNSRGAAENFFAQKLAAERRASRK